MDMKQNGYFTLKEIKEKLSYHHREKIERELITTELKAYGEVVSYIFALEGTPFRGYGIYILSIKSLCLYDLWGKRFKNYYLSKGIVGLDYIS